MTHPGQGDDISWLLFTVFTNLIRDAWRYHRVKWSEYDGDPDPSFCCEIRDPVRIRLDEGGARGWRLVLTYVADLPEATQHLSFKRMKGYPTGFVTPGTRHWPGQRVTLPNVFRGSELAQQLAEHMGLSVDLTRVLQEREALDVYTITVGEGPDD